MRYLFDVVFVFVQFVCIFIRYLLMWFSAFQYFRWFPLHYFNMPNVFNFKNVFKNSILQETSRSLHLMFVLANSTKCDVFKMELFALILIETCKINSRKLNTKSFAFANNTTVCEKIGNFIDFARYDIFKTCVYQIYC